MLFADSPYGTGNGLELTYGSGDVCSTDSSVNYKTIIRLNCTSDSFVVKDVQTDGCTTTILVNSYRACPMIGGESDIAYYRNKHGSSLIFVLALVCCLALCCTCCIRAFRRKTCRARRCNTPATNGDYSAVEFQTYNDASGQSVETPINTQPLPTPQYFMMYPPAQNGQYGAPMYIVNPQVVQPNQDQLAADEAYARQLQEQINH